MTGNSYHPAAFIDFSAEKERLRKQAAVRGSEELELLVRHGMRSDHTVLDLGCGNGELTYATACYLIKGAVMGIDVSETFIKEARETFQRPNLTYITGSVYHLPTLPAFDFIYARLVFQHLDQVPAALNELSRHLRPGGRICIIDINDEWLFLEPSLPEFEQLIQDSIQHQSMLGGNRMIGRKLPGYLKAAGFGNLKAEVIPFHSETYGIRKFMEIVISFRANQTAGGLQRYNELIRQLESREEAFFAMLGAYCISGTKNS